MNSLYEVRMVELGNSRVEIAITSRKAAKEAVWAWLGDTQRKTTLKTRMIVCGYGFPQSLSPKHPLYQTLAN